MQAPGSPEPQCAGSGEPHRAPPLPTLPAAAAPCTGVLEGHAAGGPCCTQPRGPRGELLTPRALRGGVRFQKPPLRIRTGEKNYIFIPLFSQIYKRIAFIYIFIF